MAAGIVHGSFQTVSATFDRASRYLISLQRFKELNGNKNEVGETLRNNKNHDCIYFFAEFIFQHFYSCFFFFSAPDIF
jgi:hypothetical protein